MQRPELTAITLLHTAGGQKPLLKSTNLIRGMIYQKNKNRKLLRKMGQF
jgi:hypothetical protein